jgi:hypothetical protein
MTIAKSNRQQFTHCPIHAETLLQPLLRRHGAIDLHLPLAGPPDVIGFGGGHEG